MRKSALGGRGRRSREEGLLASGRCRRRMTHSGTDGAEEGSGQDGAGSGGQHSRSYGNTRRSGARQCGRWRMVRRQATLWTGGWGVQRGRPSRADAKAEAVLEGDDEGGSVRERFVAWTGRGGGPEQRISSRSTASLRFAGGSGR